MKNKAIIVDIDGTLSDSSGRQHFMEGKKDWKSFYENMVNDQPNRWCVHIIERFSISHKIILVSGRPDDYRHHTETWLVDNYIDYDHLYMRKTGDFRADFVVKKEIYDNSIKGNWDILFCIDDRQQVVDMWRAEGLVVLQCAKGDF